MNPGPWRRLRGLCLTLAGSATAALAVAEQGQRPLSALSLEELLKVKVSVASQTEEQLRAAPSSVTVFTRDEIRNMGVTSLQDLLNYVPGFQTARDVEQGTADRISSRGRSTALSESVLFLVNGQRLNDLYTGGVSILDRLFAVGNIKQVEVVRGPGSALYGSNAFLGVVNIVTLTEANDLTLSVGNLSGRSVAINVGKRLSDDLSFSAFAGGFSDRGFTHDGAVDRFGRTATTTDPARGFDASATLTYRDLSLSARHTERTLEDFLVFGVLGSGANLESTSQSSITAGYRVLAQDKLRLDVNAGYSTDHWKAQAVLVPVGIELAPGVSLAQDMIGGPLLASYHTSLGASLRYDLAPRHTLITGLSFDRSGISDVANLNNHDPLTLEYQGGVVAWRGDRNFNEERSRDVWSAHLQDRLGFGERLTLTAGLRFDRYSDFGSSLNPRAALLYQTPWGSHMKLMYGRAFRAPNSLELYDKNNPVDFGNPGLDAEVVQTVEVAYEHRFQSLEAKVTYFRNWFDKLIVFGAPVESPSNPLGAPSFLNAANPKNKGLELELVASPLDSMIVRGSFTRMFDVDEQAVSRTAAALVVSYHRSGVKLNLSGIWRGATARLPSQDAYALVNAKAQYELGKNFRPFLSVRNLFDEKYLTFSTVLTSGVPNRGRTLAFGFHVDF